MRPVRPGHAAIDGMTLCGAGRAHLPGQDRQTGDAGTAGYCTTMR